MIKPKRTRKRKGKSIFHTEGFEGAETLKRKKMKRGKVCHEELHKTQYKSDAHICTHRNRYVRELPQTHLRPKRNVMNNRYRKKREEY